MRRALGDVIVTSDAQMMLPEISTSGKSDGKENKRVSVCLE